MGTPKPLLRYPPGPDGLPLVRRVARALHQNSAAAERVLVVVAPEMPGEAIAAAVRGEPGVEIVVNPDPERGMLSSVQAGLRRRAFSSPGPLPAAFVVCPCDLPKLEPEHVAAVLHAWEGEPGGIVAPTFGGKRGHPTLFGAGLVQEVLALDPVNYGLNEILKRHADRVCETALDDDAVLRDTDTPEEWQAVVTSDDDTIRREERPCPKKTITTPR